jgi:hypothetical protein
MAAVASRGRKSRVRMVCGTCGSEDVRIDAWAGWNEETQAWELAETFDYSFCNACEDECRIKEIFQDDLGQATRNAMR